MINDYIQCLYFMFWPLFRYWAEICQIFRWFFVKFKRHSEINWPLAKSQLLVDHKFLKTIISRPIQPNGGWLSRLNGDKTSTKTLTNEKKILNFENVLSLQIKLRPKIGNEIRPWCHSCNLCQNSSVRAWYWSRILLHLAYTMGEN